MALRCGQRAHCPRNVLMETHPMRIISLIAVGISGAAFAGNFDLTDDIVRFSY